MGTIQKRADELKPGDVLPVKDGSVVLIGVRHISADCVELMACMMADDRRDVKTRTQREFISSLVAVESPDLTPAQQHADRLVTMLEIMLIDAPDHSKITEDAHTLLAEIKPPEPPTLTEALKLLEEVAGEGKGHVDACRLLDRARRAGVLK